MQWDRRPRTGDMAGNGGNSRDALLLIGYGNDLRCDDGAGRSLALDLAERLRRDGVSVQSLSVHQLTPELSLDLAAAELSAVVFIDTRVALTAHEEVEIAAITGDEALSAGGHTCSPAMLLQYAGRLYGRRPPAWLLTVPGYKFEHGEAFSPEVQRILDDPAPLANHLLALLAS